MSKLTALFALALILCFTVSSAARPDPSLVKTQHESSLGAEKGVVEGDAAGCEGAGKEECLARRTPGFHLDYIYSVKN
ncbi:phytosulfokines 3-like [Malania oleifera]|uniref:phytosulfokines 3-like n=1 Tax=Malania oleifera TaxID=397392 RepID=UPI0025ADC419|nr:phytosulfokines 3-like [Malania oleifera]